MQFEQKLTPQTSIPGDVVSGGGNKQQREESADQCVAVCVYWETV